MVDDEYMIIQGSGILDWFRDIPEGLRRITKPKVNISTLDPFVRQMLVLAKSTYNDGDVKQIGNWTLIKSTERVKVYEYGNTIVIAVRGTKDGLDAYDDTLLAREKLDESPRFKELLSVVKQVMQENPGKRIIVTGHSLGGGMVIQLTKYIKGLEGYIFNPGVNLAYVRKSDYDLKKVNNYVMENDPLSLTSSFLPNTTKYSYPFPLEGKAKDHIVAHSLMTFLGKRQG